MANWRFVPESEYRASQADRFKREAEAMAFPRLAQRLIDLNPPQEEPPIPPQPDFSKVSSFLQTRGRELPSLVQPEETYGGPPLGPRYGIAPLGEASDRGDLPGFLRGMQDWQAEGARSTARAISGFPGNLPSLEGLEAVSMFPGAGALAGMARQAGRVGAKAAAKTGAEIGQILHTDVEKFLSKFPSGEVQNILKETIEANPQRFETARRGVLPDEVVNDMASKLGLKTEDIIRRWNPGDAANAETLQNLRAALDLKTQQIISLKEETAQAISSGIDPVIKKLRLQLAIGEQGALQEVVLGTRAEAGRGLRAFRQNVTDSIANNNLDNMQQVLRSVGEKWTDELMEQFLALPTDNVQAMYAFIRNAQQPEWWKYPLALRYSSLLSGPRTHIVNFVSNSLTTVLSPIEAGLSAAAELRAPLAGRPRERFFGEVPSMLFGMVRGVPEGLRGAMQVLKEGVTGATAVKLELRHMEIFTAGTPRVLTSGLSGLAGVGAGAVAPADSTEERVRNMGIGLIMGLAFGAAKPAWAAQALNAPTRALAAADTLWRNINFSSAMYAQAYREAAKAGTSLREMPTKIVDILSNPTPGMVTEATKQAAYRVFQQEPGKFTKWVLRGKNDFPVVQFIAPFIQTPVNLVKYGMERTPMGFAKAVVKEGGERSDAIGRALLGSGILAAAAMYGLDGKITGPSPGAPNSQERRAFEASGKIPYAILGADGKWYSYRRMEPFNLALTFAAEAVNTWNTRHEVPTEENLIGIAKTLADNLVGATWATGVFDVVDVISNPERFVGEYAAKAAASFLPFSAAIRTAGQVQSPEMREPRGPGETLASSMGVFQGVPARLSAYGEKELFQGSPLSPYRESKAREEPHITEAVRLEAVPADAPSRMLNIPISREDQARMQKDAGVILRTARPDVVASKVYQGVSDAEKQKMLKDTEAIAREYVRTYIELPAIAQGLRDAPEQKRAEMMEQLSKSLTSAQMQRITQGNFIQPPSQAVLEAAAQDISIAIQVKAYERTLPRWTNYNQEQQKTIEAYMKVMKRRMEVMPERMPDKQERALIQMFREATPEQKQVIQIVRRILAAPERYANPEIKRIRKAYPQVNKYYGEIEEEDLLDKP